MPAPVQQPESEVGPDPRQRPGLELGLGAQPAVGPEMLPKDEAAQGTVEAPEPPTHSQLCVGANVSDSAPAPGMDTPRSSVDVLRQRVAAARAAYACAQRHAQEATEAAEQAKAGSDAASACA